jgi:two-component system sensor histidine kinase VanS
MRAPAIGCAVARSVPVRYGSCRQSRRRGVASAYVVFDTPTICAGSLASQHNAVVHNLPEQGAVSVTTSARPKHVVLAAENTGDKLTPELVATLAEPFQRGSNRIRTDHAGVGLGLAIVNSIAQAHDGTSR